METLTSKQFADAFLQALEEKLNNPDQHRGLQTGIPEIDKELGGFKLGWFVLVGGAEKSGKSSQLLSWVKNFAITSGKRFYFAGFEMDNYETAERAFANVSGLSINKMRDLQITPQELTEIRSTGKTISNWNGYWNYGASSLDILAQEIHTLDPEIVVVDYFQLMSDARYSKAGRQQELSYISRTLKQISLGSIDNKKRLVIAASQLNREGAKGNLTSANYFRDTGSLEQDCNVAFLMLPYIQDNGEELQDHRKMAIVASRHSRKIEFLVRFIGERALVGASDIQIKDVNEVVKERLEQKSNEKHGGQSR